MTVSLIVAMSENRVIGVDGKLPWNIPEDLKRFRKITTNHPVIMGRKTYESIGRLLPNRDNVIISRNSDYKIEGARVVQSIEQALAPYKGSQEEVFILGGGEIFRQAMNMADKIYLTLVHKKVSGDTYFPEINSADYKTVNQSPGPGCTFIDYEKVWS